MIVASRNQALRVLFPMLDATAPETFLTGLTVSVTAYQQDGSGSAAVLAISGSVTELGATGMYLLALTAGETNYDNVVLKLTATGAADQMVHISTGGPASTPITLGPVVASQNPGNRAAAPITLEVHQQHAKALAIAPLDADGDAIDLTSKTLRFTVHTNARGSGEPAKVFAKNEGGGEITKTTNVATVNVLATDVATATRGLSWVLADTVADEVLAYGPFEILPADDGD